MQINQETHYLLKQNEKYCYARYKHPRKLGNYTYHRVIADKKQLMSLIFNELVKNA